MLSSYFSTKSGQIKKFTALSALSVLALVPAFAEKSSEKKELEVEAKKSYIKNEYAPELPHLKVTLGNEVLFEETSWTQMLKGKRIGLITNPTGVNSKFVSTIDQLANHPDWKLTALFGPEHGIRGDADAGVHVDNSVDSVTGVQVYSLYGKDKNGKSRAIPSKEIMDTLDVMVYDIQDIGNRSYTYITTMRNCMKAAAEHGKPFIVLDRPNPMGGNFVDGNILEKERVNTVGWAPVAYLYGMTCGETAKWLKDYNELDSLDLHVVPMKGWTRDMKWWDTGLPWIPTSTHMPNPAACWHIAFTGTIGELHSINEGVGYPAPFEYVGAPFINATELANEMNSRKIPGVYFRPVYYKPFYGRFEKEMCGGIQTVITDFDSFQPVEAGVHLFESLHKLYPENDLMVLDPKTKAQQNRVNMFTKVMGTDTIRQAIKNGTPAAEVIKSWQEPRKKFQDDSKKYWLY